jgi:hypothetical protein
MLDCRIDFQEESPGSHKFSASEKLWYKCRVSAGIDGHIREKIDYRFTGIMAKYADLTSCKVIAMDQNRFPLKTIRDSNDPTIPKSRIIRGENNKGREIDPIDLEEEANELYRRDNLIIYIEGNYILEDITRILTWRLSHPTCNAHFSITVPPNYVVECSTFAERTAITGERTNHCVITSTGWMLRDDGFVYRIVKENKDDTADPHSSDNNVLCVECNGTLLQVFFSETSRPKTKLCPPVCRYPYNLLR